MTELRSEKFEWFGPSPIEPFNQGLANTTKEIPVAAVARVMRMSVAGEADAIKADVLTNKMGVVCKDMPGFLTMTRTVCKEEWAYERAIVFNSLTNFQTYIKSEKREKEILPLLEDMKKLATGSVYVGNRVFDEYRPTYVGS